LTGVQTCALPIWFGELKKPVQDAVRAYADEVREGKFPGREHSF
jgi:ketopantoate hydroxymethyltransferase